MKNFELNGISNQVQFGKDGYYIITGATGLKIFGNDGVTLATIEASNISPGGLVSYWTSGSSGTNSVKIINNTALDAIGNHSIAIGSGTTASGITSFAGGQFSRATSLNSFDFSYHTVGNIISGATGDYSAILGGEDNLAFGTHSFIAGGYQNKVIGQYSFASGYRNIANGEASHAEGSSTITVEAHTHAEGLGTTASAYASHAEGRGTYSYGDYSHAEGWITKAIGTSAHSGGIWTIASGISSFDHSYHSTGNTVSGATGDYSAILGGQDNHITLAGINSAILAGTGNTINHARSIILGSYNLVTDKDDTVYTYNTDTKNNYFINGVSGYTGIFYDFSGRTVSVVGGIITNVS